MLKIKQHFSYEAYHSGIKYTIASLLQNRITFITRWSQEEAVRILNNFIFNKNRRFYIGKLLRWVLKVLMKKTIEIQQLCALSAILLSQELRTADFVKILNCPTFQL